MQYGTQASSPRDFHPIIAPPQANTPSGPCYFCCCRGGSCNHPVIFAREASRLSISPQGIQSMFMRYSRENSLNVGAHLFYLFIVLYTLS
ncbi:hypothetical protein ANCDUO_14464 [Ancylostoma duodenale]|uniref:Uncharacterized protein n=1 Tax=Ancylostoma duodenale TaxID=51022 RepID=A0A0C2CGB6_9BILA|nr:hypothetical protein ANCDUO_14464 [Ancylostoma duodenale]